MEDYSIDELKGIVASLKVAYKRAIESGGVTSYTLNSGQGSTTVQQASLASIRNELQHYTNLLNERLMFESGSHCLPLRDMGVI